MGFIGPGRTLHKAVLLFTFFFYQYRCLDQFAYTSTNPTDPEVNDHVSL